MLCAVMWLLWVLSWNLRWPWAERSGRERKAWLGTVICPLPAAIQGRGYPREYGEGRKEKRCHTMEWCQSSLSCLLQRGWYCAVPMGHAQSSAPRRAMPLGDPWSVALPVKMRSWGCWFLWQGMYFFYGYFMPSLKLLLLIVAHQTAGPVRASACLAPQALPCSSARWEVSLCVRLPIHALLWGCAMGGLTCWSLPSWAM